MATPAEGTADKRRRICVLVEPPDFSYCLVAELNSFQRSFCVNTAAMILPPPCLTVWITPLVAWKTFIPLEKVLCILKHCILKMQMPVVVR